MVLLSDIRKGFNSINHIILLKKPYCMAIDGCGHKWIKLFLIKRQQIIPIKNTMSNAKNINNGLLKESKLSPTFFFLFMKNRGSLCKTPGEVHAYNTNFTIILKHNKELVRNVTSK